MDTSEHDGFQDFLEATQDFVTNVDAQGNFLYVNPSGQRFFGLTLDELRGRPAFDFIHPDDREPTQRAFEGWLAGHLSSVRWQNRQISGTGAVVEVAWTINPRYHPDGSLRCVWAVAHDVTERERLQRDLARSNAELEQFAYVASHDLQEPLRMVSSYVQLLARRYADRLDDDARDFIAYAVDGATRMQGLINDLLTFSRVGTRGRPFVPTRLDEVLATVRKDLEVKIRESGATVDHGPLPQVTGDPEQLRQLVQNLVDNGVKFRKAHAPHIRVECEDEGAFWHLRVQDDGIGFEEQYSDRIFVIFKRLHTRDEYPGTGIGLAVAKKIVERHGGRIWSESAPGRGTTMHVTLAKSPERTRPPCSDSKAD